MQTLWQKRTLVNLLIVRKNDCPDLRRDRYTLNNLENAEEEAVLPATHLHQAHPHRVSKRKSN